MNQNISVIIPAYNSGKYIEETLHSVFNQTYSDIEIIVVNDGSTDDTLDIISKYSDKIRVYDRSNQGVSSARNFAAKEANGDWLAFIDADDLWLPNKLQTQVNGLNTCRWSHTNSFYIGENQDGTTKRSDLTPQHGGHVFNQLLTNNFITTSTVLVDKSLFLEHGGFDESLEALEDWKLWLDISKSEAIGYHEEALAEYRVYSGSTSRKARKVLPLHLYVINETFNELPNDSEHSKLKKSALIQSYSICSYIAEDAKDFYYSLLCAINALKQNPTAPHLWKRCIRTVINLLWLPYRMG